MPEIDPAFIASLEPAWQAYALQRETGWENVRAAGEHAKADALEACADFNRRAAEARGAESRHE